MLPVREVIKEGRSVEEAVDEAVRELGASRADVEVEVLSQPQRGLLGFLGSKGAVVRVWLPKLSKAEYAAEFVRQVGDYLEIPLKVVARETDEGIEVEAEGDGVGFLIGRRGETLDALQFLVNAVAAKASGDRMKVMVDVQGYRRRRVEAVRQLALRMAQKAIRQRKEIVLSPMSARERRIIHLALQDNPRVHTTSRGEEPLRRVVITPDKQ